MKIKQLALNIVNFSKKNLQVGFFIVLLKRKSGR